MSTISVPLQPLTFRHDLFLFLYLFPKPTHDTKLSAFLHFQKNIILYKAASLWGRKEKSITWLKITGLWGHTVIL